MYFRYNSRLLTGNHVHWHYLTSYMHIVISYEKLRCDGWHELHDQVKESSHVSAPNSLRNAPVRSPGLQTTHHRIRLRTLTKTICADSSSQHYSAAGDYVANGHRPDLDLSTASWCVFSGPGRFRGTAMDCAEFTNFFPELFAHADNLCVQTS